MNDYSKLQELAEAADLVDWKWWTSNSVLRLTTEREGRHGADGDAISAYRDSIQCPEAYRAFIEKASPAAIAELVAENVRLRSDYASLADFNPDWDRLKAAQDSAREHMEIIRQLKAENEALRKNADKWQIVERAMAQLQSDEQGAAIWSACSRILISVAGELNSARSTVTEEGVTFGGVEAGDWRVTVERIDAAMSKEGK
jgi:hypothetical protein